MTRRVTSSLSLSRSVRICSSVGKLNSKLINFKALFFARAHLAFRNFVLFYRRLIFRTQVTLIERSFCRKSRKNQGQSLDDRGEKKKKCLINKVAIVTLKIVSFLRKICGNPSRFTVTPVKLFFSLSALRIVLGDAKNLYYRGVSGYPFFRDTSLISLYI